MKNYLFVCLFALLLTGCNTEVLKCSVDTTDGSESECVEVSTADGITTIMMNSSDFDEIEVVSDAQVLIVVADGELVKLASIKGNFEELSFSSSQIVPIMIESSTLKKVGITYGDGVRTGELIQISSPQLEVIQIDSSDFFYLDMTITDDLNASTEVVFDDVNPSIINVLLKDAVYPPSDGLITLTEDGVAKVEEKMTITVFDSEQDISEWRSMFPEGSNVEAGTW